MNADHHRRLWLVVMVFALGPAVSNGLARFAYGLILPAMRDDLAWNYTQAGWINTANAIGYLIGALLALSLIKRLGAPRLFLFGMLLMPIALAGSGFTRDFGWQTLWRILAGIGGAPAFIAAGAIGAAVFGADSRRSALAIAISLAGGGGLGMLLSGLIIPAMLDQGSSAAWPRVWQLLGALSALALLPLPWAMRQLHHTSSDSVEPSSTRAADGQDAPSETQMPEPGSIAVGRAAAATMLAYFCFGAGFIGYITFLVAWMKANHAGPNLITACWVLMSLMVMISPFLWHGVLARGRAAGPVAAACAVAALAVPMLVVLPGPAGMLLSAAVFGGSFFIAPTAVTAFSRRNFPPAQWGSVVALFTVVFALGQIIGPVATGALADRAGGVWAGLAIAGAMLTLAALAAWTQKPIPR